jgi:hypothetical protein
MSKHGNNRIKTVGCSQMGNLSNNYKTAIAKEPSRTSEDTTGRVRPDGSVGESAYSLLDDDDDDCDDDILNI